MVTSSVRKQWCGVFTCCTADDFHSEANKDKMRAAIPLTDEDRCVLPLNQQLINVTAVLTLKLKETMVGITCKTD